MDLLLFAIGLIGTPIAIVIAIISLIRKKPMKRKLIAIVVLALMFIIGTIMPSSNSTDPDNSSLEATQSEKVQDEQQGSGEQSEPQESENPEPNTSDMVYAISQNAKEAAKTASEEDLNQAYTYICDNYTDCFGSNDIMEKMMYAGWLLEYAYDGNESMRNYYNVGLDAEQLVKYVYRDVETTDSESVQANISQIKKSIDKIEQAEAAAKKTAEESTIPDESETRENDRTVYYTKSGSKYHYENPCGRGTYYPCTLAEALSRGLEPCGKCVLH